MLRKKRDLRSALWFWMRRVSGPVPLGPPHAARHQAGEHRHHHFRLHLHQVLWERVHAGADLPSHGDGVPVEKNFTAQVLM